MTAGRPRDPTPVSDGYDAKTNVISVPSLLLFHSSRPTATRAIFVAEGSSWKRRVDGRVERVKLGVASTGYWTTNGVVVVSAGRDVNRTQRKTARKFGNPSDLVRRFRIAYNAETRTKPISRIYVWPPPSRRSRVVVDNTWTVRGRTTAGDRDTTILIFFSSRFKHFASIMQWNVRFSYENKNRLKKRSKIISTPVSEIL